MRRGIACVPFVPAKFDRAVIEEVIPAALDGQRVDRVVALLVDVSRSVAADLVEAGAVRVDGAVVTEGKRKISEGQTVSVDESSIPVSEGPTADPSIVFTVVYTDDEVAVIDKPAGLVVHPAPGHPSGTLVNGLLHRFPDIGGVGEPHRPGIVHRLDAGTTGLLVVARSTLAYDRLREALSAHSVEREYVVVVHEVPEPERGVIDAPIGRDQRDPTKMAIVPDGRSARTHYETRGSVEGGAVLLCRLETGRTHQIRVHLASIGHPVVGDPLYGSPRGTLRASRPMLHAVRLAFDHPITGERLEFRSPIPDDIRELCGSVVV